MLSNSLTSIALLLLSAPVLICEKIDFKNLYRAL